MDLSDHKNLFNGDWGTFFWAPGIWQPEGGCYSPKVIDRYVHLLAESGVDTFLINPNTQVAWYPSKVVPTALDGYTRGDRRWENWMPGVSQRTNLVMMDHYLDLLEAGVDWLAEAVVACRRHGISPWVSVRMNDMHGAGDPEGNPINCPLFRDPASRLSGTPVNPCDPVEGYWRALDYGRREVRDYMLTMVRELVQGYGFEGLELDWLRNPNVCEPHASQETIDAITTWIEDVRACGLEKAEGTRRPFACGLRIPGRLRTLRSIGLDVKAIVERGLVDFVSPSNFMQTSWAMPHDELRRELGTGIAIYGVTELVLNGVEGYSPKLDRRFSRYPCASPATLRGNAAGKLVLGADGIEQYNTYAADEDNFPDLCTAETMRADYAAIRGIHDLEALRGRPKHYALNTVPAPCRYPLVDQPEPLPLILPPQARRALRLPMCAEPDDRDLELIVQVVLERAETTAGIGVSVNGGWPSFEGHPTQELLFANRPATHHVPEHRAVNVRFGVEEIVDGWNEIVVLNGTSDGRSVKVVGVELGVCPTGSVPAEPQS